MGFIEKQAEQFVLEDLLDTLSTLEEDINLQNRQINELIKDESRKQQYITDDINIVKGILVNLDYEQRTALQNIFYQMEQHFYLCNRTEEEQQAFVRNIAEDINDLPTLTIGEDDWVLN